MEGLERRRRPAQIAIDPHGVPFYGEHTGPEVCGGKHERGDRIPVGVLYRASRPALEYELVGPRRGPLAARDISRVDISSALRELG